MMKINVAIPILNNRVAPCFEAASNFLIVNTENRELISQKTVKCGDEEGFRRVRLLKVHDIDVLICNGIKGFYRDLLPTMGVTVIPDISGLTSHILRQYLSGQILPPEQTTVPAGATPGPTLTELVNWTRKHFESHGYQIRTGPGHDSFLIDLVAEITCPVCRKTIRVAICCGAHTYRTDQEIREFNYCAKTDYNSRVFVFPSDENIARQCREYGIELISPDAMAAGPTQMDSDKIPLLKFPVEGHEQASSGINQV
nr:hypothetical protein [candidate division Zixibacteria bacterium]